MLCVSHTFQEFMFDIDSTPIDPELLDFTGKNNLGKSGGRGLIYSQERGRYIKPMIPRGKVRRDFDGPSACPCCSCLRYYGSWKKVMPALPCPCTVQFGPLQRCTTMK